MVEARVKAPEFVGIEGWLNSKPLKMESLRGKVVLVEFWTFTCINCMRTLPYLKAWHKKYAKGGLVVIGVHTPEFEFEKDKNRVKEAIKELGIEFPVALDSEMKTWEAYNNRYWPSKYLIDEDGFVLYVHFGEGNYGQTEMALQMALKIKKKIEKDEFPGYVFDQSPETYAGFGRNYGLGSGLICDDKGCNVYVDPGSHVMNVIYPHGQWIQEKEYLELKKSPGRVSYKFNAREANMVVAPLEKTAQVDIYIDEKKTSSVKIDSPRMYKIFKDKKYGERELTLIFNGRARFYALTFG